MKEANAESVREHPKSRLISSGKLHRMETHLKSWADVNNIVEMLTEEATDKVGDRVINIAKKTLDDALKTCDVDHNKSFIKAVLGSDLNGLLVSIQDK